MAASSDERERGERLFCDIGGTTVALQNQDLDPVGLFVPTDRPPELDSEVELRLRSPIGEMRARAHVVQVITPSRARIENKRAGCAMVFIELSDAQRVWIGHAVASVQRAHNATLTSLRAVPPGAGEPARGHAAIPPSAEAKVSRPPGATAVASRPPPTPRLPRALTASQVSRAAPVAANPPARAHSTAAAAAANPATALDPRGQHWAQQRPQVRDKLRQELGALDGKSPWEILGIGKDSDGATAKRAFLAMSKRYHPHAYARFDCQEISRMATQLFIAHKRAYSRMTSTRPPAPTTQNSSMPPVRVDSKRPRGGSGEP